MPAVCSPDARSVGKRKGPNRHTTVMSMWMILLYITHMLMCPLLTCVSFYIIIVIRYINCIIVGARY